MALNRKEQALASAFLSKYVKSLQTTSGKQAATALSETRRAGIPWVEETGGTRSRAPQAREYFDYRPVMDTKNLV